MVVRARLWFIASAVAMLALLMAYPAQAAFPGANGKLAVSSAGDLHYVNPDGTRATPPVPSIVAHPAWSPDGKRIAFDQVVGSSEIFVIDADGSRPDDAHHAVPYPDEDPYWSPDGTRIVFESTRAGNNRDLWVMNADGSNRDAAHHRPGPGPRPLLVAGRDEDRVLERSRELTSAMTRRTPTATSGPHSASSRWASRAVRRAGSCRAWLPTNAAMAQDVYRARLVSIGGSVAYELIWQSWCDEYWYHVVAATGRRSLFCSNSSQSAFRSGQHGRPTEARWRSWSVSAISRPPTFRTGPGETIASPFRCPSWQPIPVNGYPRPAGASPHRRLARAGLPALQLAQPHTRSAAGIRLLQPAHPAARPAHGRHSRRKRPGCQEPQQSAHRACVPGDPSTPADEADVSLRATVTDVRLRSDLSDYTGSLAVRMSLSDHRSRQHAPPGRARPCDRAGADTVVPAPVHATADTTRRLRSASSTPPSRRSCPAR